MLSWLAVLALSLQPSLAERARVDVVQFEVLAFDRHGQPVTELDAAAIAGTAATMGS